MRLGGLISAFPAVIGPVLLITAENRGAVFAARAANGTLLGLAGLAAFALSYGWVALHAPWRVSLAMSWASAVALCVLVDATAGELGFPAGLAVAVISLTVARLAMPGSEAPATHRPDPAPGGGGIASAMFVTALLVAALAAAAELSGPVIGGMLAALPLLASVLAVFTHRRDGGKAVAALLRGMVSGMAGFVGFCAVVAMVIVPAGTAAAFAGATVTAIGFQGVLALAR
jgi:hypothetical protein